MKNTCSITVGLGLVLLLLSCIKPPVIIDSFLVANATDGVITDVKVRHEPTNKYGAVNTILPQKVLEIGLSARGAPMLAEKAIVTWKDAKGVDWTVTLKLPYDQSMAKNKRPARLVYVIYPFGRAIVRLQDI